MWTVKLIFASSGEERIKVWYKELIHSLISLFILLPAGMCTPGVCIHTIQSGTTWWSFQLGCSAVLFSTWSFPGMEGLQRCKLNVVPGLHRASRRNLRGQSVFNLFFLLHPRKTQEGGEPQLFLKPGGYFWMHSEREWSLTLLKQNQNLGETELTQGYYSRAKRQKSHVG